MIRGSLVGGTAGKDPTYGGSVGAFPEVARRAGEGRQEVLRMIRDGWCGQVASYSISLPATWAIEPAQR